MYDGLPIITNKITLEEQQGIPHHILGFIGLGEESWRVGLFKKQAGKIIREIRSRGHLPILVGGTHYYTQSVLFNETLVEASAADEDGVQPGLTKQEISEIHPILDGPTEDMVQLLKEVDPVMADRWHPKDRRKIRRSLEIFLLTGKKASVLYAEQHERKALNKSTLGHDADADLLVDRRSTLLFWVYAEPEALKKRLDARIEKMLAAGLLEEVKAMDGFLRNQAKLGIEVDRTRGIWVSIGWKEFESYLEALNAATSSPAEIQKLYELSLEQMRTATRQYAKQQLRWIRLKLIPALSEDGSLDKLYLLDGSDITQFPDVVSLPAFGITETFLEGGELMPPLEVCAAAAQFLGPEMEADETANVHFRQDCDICHVVAVTEAQWQAHLKSRRHRALVKKKHKNEASGRCFPWKNDSISRTDPP